MRELALWGTRTILWVTVLGALWPWLTPLYTHAVAGLTDTLFAVLHQPFGAQAQAEGIALHWRPLRYTTFNALQQQMGYVDRFARQGLHGHLIVNVNALYMQAGVLAVLALVWAMRWLPLAQRCRRATLVLGMLIALQALNLFFSAHIEFQLRQRYLGATDTLVISNDPAWYLYFALRPVPIIVDYVLPWLIGGALAYRLKAHVWGIA